VLLFQPGWGDSYSHFYEHFLVRLNTTDYDFGMNLAIPSPPHRQWSLLGVHFGGELTCRVLRQVPFSYKIYCATILSLSAMTFDLHLRDISLEYFLFDLIYSPRFFVHGSSESL